VVVALIWLAMVAAGALMVTGQLGNASGAPAVATTKVMVQPGDTLWHLADIAAPEADLREAVSEIMRLNGLDSASDIRPGDVLVVPVQP
jgi:LysM repeat protein